MRFHEMPQERQKQVQKQIRAFKERFLYENKMQDKIRIDIVLTPDFVLKDYVLTPGVFQPDKMTAIEFARWVRYNNGEYTGKYVIDMCCGGGIQGIVALLSGADRATFVDYSKEACQNTLENVIQYGLDKKAKVIQSDLFAAVPARADMILVNPPFFPGDPLSHEPLFASMCFGEEKAKELYREAIRFAPKMAVCYWDFAGTENDPENLAPQFRWDVERRLFLPAGYGIQQTASDHYHFKVNILTRPIENLTIS